MATRPLFDAKSLQSRQIMMARRPKSAHVSHRGQLVLALSPRANRAQLGVNDTTPSKWHVEAKPRVVQRYCVLDYTLPPSMSASTEDEDTEELPPLKREPSSVAKPTEPSTPSKPSPVQVQPPPESPPNDVATQEADVNAPRSSTTAAMCLSAYQARKQAEEEARLLANRLHYLNMEKAKAQSEAERLQLEYYREQDAKLAFERQKDERAYRAMLERQRIAEKHSHAVALQAQHRSKLQQQAQLVAEQKRRAALRVKDQQKLLEEDKKAREATLLKERLHTKQSVQSQHERAKLRRIQREKHNREKLEKAQAERLRSELQRETMAKHLVARMQAEEHTLRGMLEFQEQQQRIEMQRCFDTASYVVPDEFA
ncbi:hypothetical protein AC1031_013442 [Aphanomyces cochlioides]|nr:hypothetical protein AC1031_013442 [Aphanomyces cochlioides]